MSSITVKSQVILQLESSGLHVMACKLKSVLATKSQIPKDGKANAEFHNSSVKTLPG